MRPFQQGDLDGLCGIYALVNALHELLEIDLPEEFTEDIFQIVAGAIPRREYPDVLWQGMDVDRVERLARASVRHIARRSGIEIEVTRPFAGKKVQKLTAYLEKLAEIEAESFARFIVAIEQRDVGYGHWSVLKKIGSKTLTFADSSDLRKLKRRDVDVWRGVRHRMIPEETIVLRLVAVEGKPI